MKLFGGKFGGARSTIMGFVTKMVFGLGVGMAGDFLVETFRVPGLNNVGTFGNPNMSNYEYFVYGLGTFVTVAGVADLATGRKAAVMGITKDAMPGAIGLMLGTYFYEHTIVNLLGLRKYNIYELLGHLVPPVLPPGTPTPGPFGRGHTFPGSQELTPATGIPLPR